MCDALRIPTILEKAETPKHAMFRSARTQTRLTKCSSLGAGAIVDTIAFMGPRYELAPTSPQQVDRPTGERGLRELYDPGRLCT